MNQFLNIKHFLKYVLPLSIICLIFVSINFQVKIGNETTEIWGFPLPYKTFYSCVNSLEYKIFVLPILFDLFVFLIINSSILYLIKSKLNLRFNNIFKLLFLITIWGITSYILFIKIILFHDANYQWVNEFKYHIIQISYGFNMI